MTIININCCPISTQKPLSSSTPAPTITKTSTPTPTPTITPTPTTTPTVADATCVGCANYYNGAPQYVTDQNGHPGIIFPDNGVGFNGCPGTNLLPPQAKSPSGAWLFLVPRNTADNATVNSIMTSSTLGALGTIEWNDTNPWTGAPITDRSSLTGHRWRFVEYIQPATTYETRGTAYTLGEDVLATMCVSSW